MPDKRTANILRLLLYAAMAILVIYLTLKFIFPWTAPFILAFLTAMCLEPAVKYVEKHTSLKRWIISAILTILYLTLLFLLGQLIVTGSLRALSDFITDLPATLSGVTEPLSWINEKIFIYIGSAPENIREHLTNAIDNIILSIQKLPSELSGTAIKLISNIISYMPKILLFSGTYAVSIFFISSCYGEVRSFLLRQIPREKWHKYISLKAGILGTIIKWLKAQLMLLCITFLELSAGFIFLHIEHAALIAAIVALIDALPVLGVGTVLLPWAVFKLITGNTAIALGFVILYASVTLLRSLLEPKLVGAQLGLHPVATLLAMYIGFSSTGILGMILFPMGLMIIKKLNDDNILKLWR